MFSYHRGCGQGVRWITAQILATEIGNVYRRIRAILLSPNLRNGMQPLPMLVGVLPIETFATCCIEDIEQHKRANVWASILDWGLYAEGYQAGAKAALRIHMDSQCQKVEACVDAISPPRAGVTAQIKPLPEGMRVGYAGEIHATLVQDLPVRESLVEIWRELGIIRRMIANDQTIRNGVGVGRVTDVEAFKKLVVESSKTRTLAEATLRAAHVSIFGLWGDE